MAVISIIVPCYNEEASLPFFLPEIKKVADHMSAAYSVNLDILFINDGSKDNTLAVLRDAAAHDSRVRYLSFSRNFGKEAAIYAGLEHSTGDYVVLMDADLQDPPSLLPDMLRALDTEGYDSAATRRVTRQGEPPVRSFFARLFYKLINRISDVEIMDGARDYRMMTRKMTNAVLDLKEYNRFSKGIFGWVGFRTRWFAYENRNRVAGETKWSFWKLLAYSIEGIIAFSTAPLSIAIFVGLLCFGLAFAMILFIVIKTLLFGDPVGGWPSLTCIVLLVGGVQLFCTGIIGKYLSKTYLETKNRPKYILREDNLEAADHNSNRKESCHA